MSVVDITAAVREMLLTTLLLATPFLAATVLVAFVVCLLQASTRINDLTLSFVPRFAIVLVIVYLGGTWAVANMGGYIVRSFALVRSLGG